MESGNRIKRMKGSVLSQLLVIIVMDDPHEETSSVLFASLPGITVFTSLLAVNVLASLLAVNKFAYLRFLFNKFHVDFSIESMSNGS